MGILRTDKISGLETPTPVTGSVEFDGSGDYLQTPDSEIFSLGTNDYTIEGWFYLTTLSATQRIFGQRAADAGSIQMLLETNASGELRYYFAISDSSKNVGGVVATQINTWHHIAVVRKNLVHTLYVDGVSVATNSTDTGTLNNRSQPFSIGRQGDYTSDAFNGHISNFRICKGTAVYTSDFTVPTHALEVTQDTVLLCCNNPDSVTASDHGRVGAAPPTLTANGDPAVSSINPGLTRDFTSGTEFSGVTVFDTQGYFVPPSGTTEQRGRGRGLFGGGSTPTRQNIIDFVNIASTGNTQDFGDLTRIVTAVGGCASATRGLFGGGYNPSVNNNTIEFVTIATTGNAINFGDLAYTPNDPPGGLSNNTRGIFAGGEAPAGVNNINFVTIASLGDATDFGDLFKKRRQYFGSCSSPTRGLFAGGYDDTSPASRTNVIEYITIATAGNGLNFGDLNAQLSFGIAGVSSKTRGVFMGGYTAPDGVNTIQYVTISTLGNAQDFGDLTISALARSSGVSNSERGLAAGGATPTLTNTIDYITIATTGDAKDFGDLLLARRHPGGLSDSHGGIS
jgi:hypothetical protein